VQETRVILIRHGESQGNASSICECSGDSALTARGEAQALRLAERLPDLFPTATALYASPRRRAQRTAEIVARAVNLAVAIVADIREIDIGEWEGQPLSAVDLSPLRKDADFTLHGGESPRECAVRTARAIREFADVHVGETILAVGHGAAFAAALAFFLESEPLFGNEYGIPNAGFAELWFDPLPRLAAIESLESTSTR